MEDKQVPAISGSTEMSLLHPEVFLLFLNDQVSLLLIPFAYVQILKVSFEHNVLA